MNLSGKTSWWMERLVETTEDEIEKKNSKHSYFNQEYT